MLDRRGFLLTSTACAGATGFGLVTGCATGVSTNPEQGNSPESATIYSNGIICSVPGAVIVEAVAVQDGRFISVGSLEEVEKAAGPNCEYVDLEGCTLIPSFFEAHAHPNLGSLFDLREFAYENNLPTPQSYVKYAQQFLEEHPDIQALRGSGWNISDFPDGYPQKELLDQVSTDIPIFIRDAGQHLAWVNSKALELAGITPDSPDPEGGRIERDGQGEPLGTVVDMATNYVEGALPPVSVAEEKELILKFQEMAHSLGVTGHMCAAVLPDSNHYLAYRELHSEGTLKMYSQLAFYMLPESYKETVSWLRSERASYEEEAPDELLSLGLAKFFIDGVVSGQTACLLKDYSSWPGYRGKPLWPVDSDALHKAFRLCNDEGLRIHIHAVGDAAVRFGLDALEEAAEPNRHAITHILLADPHDITRFKELDIIATVNPYWFCKGPAFEDIELLHLGEDRCGHLYPTRSFYECGVTVAAASDYPVSNTPAPLAGIEMAVTRSLIKPWRGGKSIEECTLNPSEGISLNQALEAFTLSAAFAYGLEDTTGSIDAGKSADFVVLDRNIFVEPPSEACVLETWFKGELVYRR